MAKATLWMECPARAKPSHSVISPRKLAPDTYSNIPPTGGMFMCIKQPNYLTFIIHCFTFQNTLLAEFFLSSQWFQVFFGIIWVDSSTTAVENRPVKLLHYEKITVFAEEIPHFPRCSFWAYSFLFPCLFPFIILEVNRTDSTALDPVPIDGVLTVFCFSYSSTNALQRLPIYRN